MNSYERKLRKKARKLAKWAKKHGIDHAHIFVIGPTEEDLRWYADSTAYAGGVRVANTSDFYMGREL